MKNERKKNAILGQRTGFARTEKSFEITNLDNIVTELNRLHQSILTAGKNMVRFAVEAGEILTKKKDELEHGEFIPWVENNLNFKIRTAQRYMKIFEKKTK
ncbi:PF11300 domain protein [Leptospira interrogans serovar Zanoni str. LT2156]|uniref:PF11300 domain protein n=1 Tax=Leptospira interrogans serovar Zanoni str. LT2156 TaxID=1001601 RepID=M6HFY0_LEPIR|nr:PF11300 domain protein [Leptospira interrogans serovar Zanoni str. LT2156]